MRRRRHQQSERILVLAMLASAFAHAIFGPFLISALDDYLSGAGAHPPPVKVVKLTAEQWSQNLRTNDSARKPNPASPAPEMKQSEANAASPLKQDEIEPPKPEERVKLNGQIVEVPPSADDSANPDAKYLSKYNVHVDKETIARPDQRDRRFKRVTNKLQTTGDQNAPQAPIVSPQVSVKGDGKDEDKPGKQPEQKMVLKVPDIQRRDKIDLKLGEGAANNILNRDRSDQLKGNSDHFDLQLGANEEPSGELGGTKGSPNGSDKRALPTISALMPTLGTLAQISGSPSPDHVDGVQEGDATFLNTKEFKYATFFYRVRDSVFDHWVDAAAREYRRRDPTGNIYGVRDRATMLAIELSPQGELDDVRVERTSGVEFLDAVAIEAFKRAQPFPNPPAGIVDEDGHIRFNFQFIITMSPSSGLNLFKRY